MKRFIIRAHRDEKFSLSFFFLVVARAAI